MVSSRGSWLFSSSLRLNTEANLSRDFRSNLCPEEKKSKKQFCVLSYSQFWRAESAGSQKRNYCSQPPSSLDKEENNRLYPTRGSGLGCGEADLKENGKGKALGESGAMGETTSGKLCCRGSSYLYRARRRKKTSWPLKGTSCPRGPRKGPSSSRGPYCW